MSDFLTRMAERALGTAPRIDPQSASRYSPSRLPLPESPLPEMTKAPAFEVDSLAPTLDRHERPAMRERSGAPTAAPLLEDALATGPSAGPAAKSDRAPIELRTTTAQPLDSTAQGIQPLELQSNSITQRRPPVESESRSIALESPDAEHRNRARTPKLLSVDALRVTAASETSMMADGVRASGPASGPRSAEETNSRAFDDYAASPSREENEPRAVSRPIMNDRDIESKLGIEVESIRSETAPRDMAVGSDRRAAAAVDQPDSRGAIAPDSIRPAAARVEHYQYEQEENSEPTIRVTIGRVEVRSAPPPAVVEPVAAPAPKLSLAEFLRQHNERRR